MIEALAVWGMRWARDEMAPDDLDVTFLMFDIQRRIDTDALPDGETVICFSLSDLDAFGRWWLVCNGPEIDLCYADPGKDVDLYVTGKSRDMIGVWMGDVPLRSAIKVGDDPAHRRRAFAPVVPQVVYAVVGCTDPEAEHRGPRALSGSVPSGSNHPHCRRFG